MALKLSSFLSSLLLQHASLWFGYTFIIIRAVFAAVTAAIAALLKVFLGKYHKAICVKIVVGVFN